MAELTPVPDTSPSPTRGASSTRQPRLLMPTLVLVAAITSLVSSLGAPLVPDVAEHYRVSLGSAQWVLTATLLVGAVATPIVGRLGGNRRRRPVVLLGLVVVAVGLLLAALPTGFAGLIAGRLLQGVGIALVPLVLAAARETLPAGRVGPALALLSVTTVAGAGIGYPLSAWMTEEAGLSAAYWLAFAVTLATLALTALALPPSQAHGSDSVHWLGAGLLTVGTLGLLLAMTLGPRMGWQSWPVAGLGLLGVTSLVLWVRQTLRHPEPLVDLRLAGQRGILPANIAAITAGAAVYMTMGLVMVQAQLPTSTGFGLGEPVTTAGLLLTPYAIASLLGSRLCAVVGRAVGPDLILPIGTSIYFGATVLFALAHDSVWMVAVVMAGAGAGGGFTFAAMPGLVLRSTPPRETGSAMAFNVLLRYLGFAVGSTLATTLLAMFSAGDRPDRPAFLATVWINAGLWLATALICCALIPSRNKETP